MAEPADRDTGQKQAGWRVDPALSGPGGCIGDIGTHAFHLVEYITGLKVTGIHGTLRSVVPGRRVDDDCTALLKSEQWREGSVDYFADCHRRRQWGAPTRVWGKGVILLGAGRSNRLR